MKRLIYFGALLGLLVGPLACSRQFDSPAGPFIPTATPDLTLTFNSTSTATTNPAVTATATCLSPESFGETAAVTNYGFIYNNSLTASRETLSVPATLQSLSIFFVSGVGPVQMGIYQDNGSNYPGTLLAQTASQTVGAGWNTLLITNTFLSPGTYWLSLLGSASLQPGYEMVIGSSYYCTANGFPASFPVSMFRYNNRYCMHGNFCLGTGVPTFTATPTWNGCWGWDQYGNTATCTPTPTGTWAAFTPTSTFTSTSTPTPTPSFASTGTNSPTDTFTFAFSMTFTATPTNSFTGTPCGYPGNTCTMTSTSTPTSTPTYTTGYCKTWTPTPTFTNTLTSTFTPTGTLTPSNTPNLTASPGWTSTLTPTDVPCGYPGPTCTPTFCWIYGGC